MRTNREDVIKALSSGEKMTSKHISEITGLTERNVKQTIYMIRSDIGSVEIERIGNGESFYFLCDDPNPYKKFYVELYEKMATDNPRELWSFTELTSIYNKSYDCIKAAITRIRKNICGVECIRIRDEFGRLISHYRLLDGD